MMKKTLLFLMAVVMSSIIVRADVTINSTNFPDANFRSYLQSLYPAGYITDAQLQARDTLYLYNKGISNMKGVEYFTNLTYLMCYQNNLSTIDVSANTKLTYLNLGRNKLTSVSVTGNTELLGLYLQNNLLTTVSVNDHSKLKTLWVQQNPNLTGLYCWRDALTNVDVTGCTALKQLKIYNNYNLTSIYGLSDCTALTWLDVEDTSFGDLSAVKSMTSLETLLAGNTQITTLETSHSGNLKTLYVAGDTRLTELKCYSENLTTLKVTGCTALTNLRCYYNYDLPAITGLADCTALSYIDCEDCKITSLPGVNNMQGLQTLWCRNNQLTSLEVTHKSQLKYLRVSGNTGLTVLVCDNNALISLVVTGCTALQHFDCQSNPSLAQITGLSDCTSLDWFACDYCALSSSLDMTFAPNLVCLYCYDNDLTSLNVTGLSELLQLNCMNNPNLANITGLADCTKISYLNCSCCALTSLSVSQMSDLHELWCSNNQFNNLTVVNKRNLTTLVASDNTNLAELYCYDCALTRLDVDNCNNLYYIDCGNNELSSLNINSCPNLELLDCTNNQLTQLGISNNPKLKFLWCNSNQLTSLDLSHCSDDFFSLDCRYNQIAGTIDLSRFAALEETACSGNQISQLIMGNHPSLKLLWCEQNQLASIDVSGCPALQTLLLYDNQLSTLDVHGLSNLTDLYVQYNQLTSLNVSNCPSLRTFPIYNNDLTAGPMGHVVDDLPTLSNDDRGLLYAIVEYPAESEHVERNVITAAQVSQAAAKYWDVYCWNWDTSSWEPYAGSAFLRGDVDNSGTISIADVTALIDYILSGDPSSINIDASDVDANGSVNIADVTALIDYLLGGHPLAASPGRMKAPVPGHDVKIEFTVPTKFEAFTKPGPVKS